MVAYKTAPSQGLNAVLVDAFIAVAFRTIVHFHAIPGVAFQPEHVLAPNITAIAGDAVFFVGTHMVGFPDMPVTLDTLHFAPDDMGGVREKDTVWLPGIN